LICKEGFAFKNWDDVRKEIANETTVPQDRKSGILTIAVSDRNPQWAQTIAQEYVSELDRVVTTLNTSSANRGAAFWKIG
jgi:capsule polysaccharide export protein KpsE/RkpR